MFPAAALALASFGDQALAAAKRRAAVVAVVAGTVLTCIAWGAIPPRPGFRSGFQEINFAPVTEAARKKKRALHELIALVPADAPVAVTELEVPHVSNRLNTYTLRDGAQGADYLLYDSAGSNGMHHALAAQASGEFEEMARRGSMVLLRKK